MRTQHVTVGLAVLIGATLASGVAVAARPAPKVVKACVNKHGVLGVGTTKGKCAAGYTNISLNVKGPTGARGEPGPKGPTGTFSAADVTTVRVSISLPSKAGNSAIAVCPTGDVVIGGGAAFEGFTKNDLTIFQSEPTTATGDFLQTGQTGAAWSAGFSNVSTETFGADVWAICAK